MRRIKTIPADNHRVYGGDLLACQVITERDLCLLLAVARAAEQDRDAPSYERLWHALDRLNAKPKGKRP
jgi:hypothetical protein